jgi:hypothetical protein
VAEVDAGLQQLFDPDLGHGPAPLVSSYTSDSRPSALATSA